MFANHTALVRVDFWSSSAISEDNEDGFWAQIKEYPTVFSRGTTLGELKSNAAEALRLFFEESNERTLPSFDFDYVYDIQEIFQVNDYIAELYISCLHRVDPPDVADGVILLDISTSIAKDILY